MTRPHAFARAGALAAAGALLATVVMPPSPASAAARTADTVRMFIESVSPSTPSPAPASAPKRLTISIRFENTSDTDYKNVKLVGERGDPIENQARLDSAMGSSAVPSSPGLPVPAIGAKPIEIPPQGTVHTTFTLQYSRANDGSGLCLCAQHAVYPLYFSARVPGNGGVDQRLGFVATYLPAFFQKPAPERVTWLWPLIDQPHRLLQDAVFTDDQLAGTVALGGRLDRALRVVEQVGPTTPLTLVVDPELIDELAVMASNTGYRVQSGAHTVSGTGRPAAVAWLDRLRTVLGNNPGLRLEFTPYADPDVESLSRAQHTWSTTMPPAMSARVSASLPGVTPDATVAWPASGAVSSATLKTLVATGTGTVVLNSTAVAPSAPAGAVASGLARLESNGSDVAAALVSPAVEKYVTQAIGPNGAASLPSLVAELAIRAAQESDAEHAVVLTAPRYVNPSVESATRAIQDTSRSTFSEPVSLRDLVGGNLLPTGRSQLARVPASAAALPQSTVEATSRVADALPDITSLLTPQTANGTLLTPGAAALALLADLPVANQRAASSAWRQRDRATVVAAQASARTLTERIDSIENGVQIVRPSSGAYTLASNSSPLPITVDNKLPYPVSVRISISTDVNGLPGFSTKDIGVKSVDSNQKRTLPVPATTERNGRIKVHAVLLTPNNVALGESVPLTVRSTALGAIGVIITVAAGVVLALALLIRGVRQVRKRRRPSSPPGDAAARRMPETVA